MPVIWRKRPDFRTVTKIRCTQDSVVRKYPDTATFVGIRLFPHCMRVYMSEVDGGEAGRREWIKSLSSVIHVALLSLSVKEEGSAIEEAAGSRSW